jgi:putative beta-lysine N-acetyltransferase
LIKTGKSPSSSLASELVERAKKNGYSKIFAKVPFRFSKNFYETGFIEEGRIPGLHNDIEDVLFLSFFLDPKRQIETSIDEVENVLDLSRRKANPQSKLKNIPEGAVLRQCDAKDAEQMSEIYKKVYLSYPFPIDDPEYIAETMKENFIYFCIEVNNKIVALSSVELFKESNYVEMTDFATLPDFRAKGFAGKLLQTMEEYSKRKGFQTAFTVARAVSPGMNITFSKSGYTYGGRLVNNTNISGQIESMNIWYKKL